MISGSRASARYKRLYWKFQHALLSRLSSTESDRSFRLRACRRRRSCICIICRRVNLCTASFSAAEQKKQKRTQKTKKNTRRKHRTTSEQTRSVLAKKEHWANTHTRTAKRKKNQKKKKDTSALRFGGLLVTQRRNATFTLRKGAMNLQTTNKHPLWNGEKRPRGKGKEKEKEQRRLTRELELEFNRTRVASTRLRVDSSAKTANP
jgi:hypothetical protein